MIRYSLKCAQGHSFESWFQSAQAFDSLARSGHIECPICGDTTVEKALMSPQLAPKDKGSTLPAPSVDPQPTAIAPDMPQKLKEAFENLRAEVEKNSDYVGRSFAQEARDMHDGVVPERAIHGEANLEEARSLVQDGVPILPLPFRDRRGTN